MESFVYREATSADIPEMARIRALRQGTEEGWQTRIFAYLKREHHPQEALPERILYVATEGGAIVGLIAGHLTHRFGCQGELQWIDVVPERRGKGVSVELLRLLIRWFLEQQARRVCVNVEPANVTARKFYTRCGAKDLNDHWLVWDDVELALGHARL